MKKRSSVFNVVMIISLTFLAKIIGFLRDAFIGYSFGASDETDIYTAAIGFTTIVFLGIGSAIATNTIPIVVRYRKEGRGKESISNISTAIVLLSFIGSVIYFVLAPAIVPFLVPGYSGDKLLTTIQITRWMIPALMFIGIMYFYVGVLQANEQFVLPATSSFLFNFLFFIYIGFFIDDFGIVGLAAITTMGWLLQLIYLLPLIIKERLAPFKFHIDFKDPILRNFLIGIVPIALVTLTHQFNIIIDNRFASLLGESYVSVLYFGNMIFVAITTVTVNGITAVMFPKFNEKLLEKNHDGFYQSVVNVLRSVALLLVPMSVGMILVGPHVIKIIFQRGQFDATDVAMTVIAFTGYTSLMLAFGFIDVLNKAFYALNNRRTPMLIGLIITVMNVILSYSLSKVMGFKGIPIATALSFYIGATISFGIFYKMEKGFTLKLMSNTLFKVIAAAILMGVSVHGTNKVAISILPSGEIGTLVTIIIDVVVGVGIYVLTLILLKEQLIYHNIGLLKERLLRRNK